MKTTLLIALLCLLLVACTSQEDLNTSEMLDYQANYESSYSSSSGSRLWNLSYTVVNETVVACEGYFEFSGRDSYVKPCNISDDFVLRSEIRQHIPDLTNETKISVGNMSCYHNVSNPQGSPMTLFVCFDNKDNIVAYGGKGGYGGIRTVWYIEGYMPNAEWYSYN